MAAKIRTWVVATAFVCLLALAGGWFLLISPKMAAEAETQAATADESARTITLTKQLGTLKEQFAKIDSYRTDLASLRAQVPPAVGIDSFLVDVQRIADATGVTVQSMTAGAPSVPAPAVAPVAGPAPAADGAAASPTPTPTPSAAAADPAAPAPTVNAAGSDVVAVPMSFTVVGTYAATSAFLDALQTGTTRLFLVGGFTATSQDDVAATSIRPATSRGDLEMVVDGFIYVLPTTDVPAAGGGAAATPTPAPMPASERNPFAPIG